jgi:hypothetical protein
MKIGPLAILFACIFACSHDAAAQAIAQTVVINQTTMQNVGNAKGPQVQVNGHPAAQTPQQAAKDQTVIEYAVADPQRPLPDCGCAKQPFFSVDSGNLVPGTQVTITSASPGAVIFYTADGWTPTEASTRYTGPITINADTRLQAFAEEPAKLPSAIEEVTYTVKGSPAPKPDKALAVGGILLKGTPLRLVTGADVTSDTAQVGDHILLLLDENVMVGETIVAPKGSQVEATITRVDRAGRAGKPGVLAFQVQSLNAHGTPIPLNANLTLSAPDIAAQTQRNVNASLVHVASALPPGDEAEIEPGMALIAAVGADTPLRP